MSLLFRFLRETWDCPCDFMHAFFVRHREELPCFLRAPVAGGDDVYDVYDVYDVDGVCGREYIRWEFVNHLI